MGQKVAYWGSLVLIVAAGVMSGITYLLASPQAVEGFAHVGYPQQLRVILGVAKLAGAIVLVAPRLPLFKEWAYAGFTFAWICAFVAHYAAGDGAIAFAPLVLIVLLAVSYVTRPASRRLQPRDRGVYN